MVNGPEVTAAWSVAVTDSTQSKPSARWPSETEMTMAVTPLFKINSIEYAAENATISFSCGGQDCEVLCNPQLQAELSPCQSPLVVEYDNAAVKDLTFEVRSSQGQLIGGHYSLAKIIFSSGTLRACETDGLSCYRLLMEENNEINSDQKINLSEELSKLNDLKEKGIISQEEFEKAKNKLLNN